MAEAPSQQDLLTALDVAGEAAVRYQERSRPRVPTVPQEPVQPGRGRLSGLFGRRSEERIPQPSTPPEISPREAFSQARSSLPWETRDAFWAKLDALPSEKQVEFYSYCRGEFVPPDPEAFNQLLEGLTLPEEEEFNRALRGLRVGQEVSQRGEGRLSGLTAALKQSLGELRNKLSRGERVTPQAVIEEQAAQAASENLLKRLAGVKILNQPIAEFLYGGLAGAMVRNGTRLALTGALGWGAVPVGGAAAGGTIAALKEISREKRAYRDFKRSLTDEGLGQRSIQEIRSGALDRKYEELRSILEQTTDRKQKEAISDQVRHLGVYIKCGQWVDQYGASQRISGREVLNQFLTSLSESRTVDNVDQILGKAARINGQRMAGSVVKGAVVGAVGGAIGGALIEHFGLYGGGGEEAAPAGAPEAPVAGTEEVVVSGGEAIPLPVGGGVTPPEAPAPGGAEMPPPVDSEAPPEVTGGVPEAGVQATQSTEPFAQVGAEAGQPPGVEKPAAQTQAASSVEAKPPVEVAPAPQPKVEAFVGAEKIALPSGSNPWHEMERYLTDRLGHSPASTEIAEATTRVLVDNNITDPTNLHPGLEMNLAGVNEYVGSLVAGEPPIPLELSELPLTVGLPKGSTLLEVAREYSEIALGHPPSPDQALMVAKDLARSSNVAIPEWDIPGKFLDTQLAADYPLNFDEKVRTTLAFIMAGKKG